MSTQKLQTFISLFLTLTKLCHVKHDHLVNFYISLEKSKKIVISLQQHDRSSQNLAWWCTTCLSSAPPIKSNFKNPRRGRPMCSRDPFCIIVRYCSFSIFRRAAVCHLRNLKLKFLTASRLRDVLHLHTFTFCGLFYAGWQHCRGEGRSSSQPTSADW